MSTNWSPRALDLLHKRYFAFQQDLTIDEWLDKVTQHYVSYYTNSDEKNIWQGHYKDLLARRAFFPTSAALINPLRAPNLGLSGCMVIPIEKTLREINSITKVAILNALLDGIGVGLDLSELPPRLSPDDASGRAFPGPVEILRSIVLSTKPLVDYSGVKRAAYMASLSAEHPDIFSFSRVKMDYEISDANISVAISPDFNQAFNAGEMLLCKYGYGDSARVLTRDDLAQMHALAVSRGVPAPDLQITNEGKVFSSAANRIVGNTQSDGRVMLDPTEILKFIAECAHRKGDPGLLNLDVINDFNPTKDFNVQANGRGLIRTTTPCGEQPLLPYEVCHLGSISLPHYLGSGKAFDYNSLKKDISIIVRMMDDIVEVSDNGSQNSNSVSKSNRKIGIGIMGLADVLVSRGFAYDSEQAHTFSSDLQRFIQEECALVSEKLAEERGPFPNWQYSIYKDGKPRRNATLTTIAPTGHISVLADCSTSIEPHFSHSYVRKAAGDHHETVSVLQDE
ncbi:MAG: hypothetical protein KA998_04635, partial [Rickettsiaceae bacterium]|nr:hypothetical protein [Rickettsiaceae bacterium]